MSEIATMRLYWHIFESIHEYSTSLPTGTTIGKVWRRNDARIGFGNGPWDWQVDGTNPRWRIGIYAESGDPKMVRILWFDVELLEGPAPPGYYPPDWSNYAAWKRERDEPRRSLAASV